MIFCDGREASGHEIVPIDIALPAADALAPCNAGLI